MKPLSFLFKNLKKKPKKIGLALGGGAARGFAHLGVVQGLRKHNIPIDYLGGTSAGSIVGGFIAAGVPIEQLIAVIPKLRWKDFAKLRFSRKALFSSDPIERQMRSQIGDVKFKDLKIPFAPLATDLLTGQAVAVNYPNLEVAKGVCASASFPGVFSPYEINGCHFVDGGASANVPVGVVRDLGADVVIAVDIIPHVSITKIPKHMATIADRGLDLLLHNVSQKLLDEADYVIKPFTKHFNSFGIKKGLDMIELGREAVEQNIGEIKALVS